MFAVILIIIFTVLAYFIRSYRKENQKYKSLDQIPGPPGYPIIGNVLDFGRNGVDRLDAFTQHFDTYGPTIKFWVGGFSKKMYVTTIDPEMTEFFLSSMKYIKKSANYEFLRPWLGNSLLLSNGSHWQKRRKMIVPAFHFKILEDYLPIFNNAGEILVSKLNKEIGQDVTDIQPFLTAYTLDIICETAMGTTVNAQENHNNEYMKCIEDMNQIFSQRVLSVWKKIDRLFVYSNDYKIQTKALNYIHTYDDSVIAKRRELLLKDQNKDTEEITDDFEIKKRRAFLDVLLKSTVDGKPLKNHEIREEVDTIMFGGQDTCSGTLGFMFYALSKHPKIQAKLVEELKEIFGNDIKRLPTVEDFSKMKYTELVIKETLRYYQTVPFIARQLTEDVIYNGILYPKDTNIMIMPYYMHRRTDLFENPEEFNPDRFLYENNQNRNPFSYIPFSAGPRNCLGQKFAMFELKLTIIKVLLNYEIKPVASKYDPILSCGMMLRSINGISIKLEKRKLH